MLGFRAAEFVVKLIAGADAEECRATLLPNSSHENANWLLPETEHSNT